MGLVRTALGANPERPGTGGERILNERTVVRNKGCSRWARPSEVGVACRAAGSRAPQRRRLSQARHVHPRCGRSWGAPDADGAGGPQPVVLGPGPGAGLPWMCWTVLAVRTARGHCVRLDGAAPAGVPSTLAGRERPGVPAGGGFESKWPVVLVPIAIV